jgi:D-alanyl-D-alanine carboxypeptidase
MLSSTSGGDSAPKPEAPAVSSSDLSSGDPAASDASGPDFSGVKIISPGPGITLACRYAAVLLRLSIWTSVGGKCIRSGSAVKLRLVLLNTRTADSAPTSSDDVPMLSRNRLAFWALALVAQIRVASPTLADGLDNGQIAARLKAAYSGYVVGAEGGKLKFKSGNELRIDDDRGKKSFNAWLAEPDIKDMFRYDYPHGEKAHPPAPNFDPGRARNEAFFNEIYGDCRKPGFAASLTTITWLAKKAPQKITISERNGVAEHLRAVSKELDALPAKDDIYLTPSAGGYMCRTITGTAQRSGHGYGIAIDIATKRSHYWRWAKGGPSRSPVYHNDIPPEIVSIFEKHGFIWGGRWYHYDTMHFEYRPELLGGK